MIGRMIGNVVGQRLRLIAEAASEKTRRAAVAIPGDGLRLPGGEQPVGDLPSSVAKRPSASSSSALQDDESISSFLSQDYAATGRLEALRMPTHEALELGRRRILTDFDNILDRCISKRVVHGHRLEQLMLDLGNGSALMVQKLKVASAHNQQHIDQLQEQRRQAPSGSGWCGAVLSAYSAGFARGLREATDIDQLFR
jgi:hypothetical protein